MGPVVLAELEVWHSRPIAPTRRVALGDRLLPVEPAPGYGGLLLAGVVAAHAEGLDPELVPDLHRLLDQVQRGRRIAQPRLRHRFQVDRVGLSSTRHRLLGQGEELSFDIGNGASPAQQILGAVYAAVGLPPGPRRTVVELLHRAVPWRGEVGPDLVVHLTGRASTRGWSMRAVADPRAWALQLLGFNAPDTPRPEDIKARFRALLREAHPDHGALSDGAGQRILELTEARRILLS